MSDIRYKIENNFNSSNIYLNRNLFPYISIQCFLFFIFCFLSTSCNHLVNKRELNDYINNPGNGLKQEVKSGDYKISLTYHPTDLLVEQDLLEVATITSY